MVKCSAYQCPNGSEKKKDGITCHKFPVDPQRRKLWIKAVRTKNWQPTNYSSLCSVHFEERYIERRSSGSVRLKSDAVPTLFLKVGNKPRLTRAAKQSSTKEELSHVKKQQKSVVKSRKRHVQEASNVEDISYSVQSTSTKEEPSCVKRQRESVAKSSKHNKEASNVEDISQSFQATSIKEEPSHVKKQQKSVAKSRKLNVEEASNVEDLPTTKVELPPPTNNFVTQTPRFNDDDNNLHSLKKFYCRLCAKKERDLVSAFGEEGELLDIVEKISRFLPIVLMSGDELPTSICYLCIQKLNTSYYFIETTLRAETVLKQKLEAIKSNMASTQMENNIQEPEAKLGHDDSSTEIQPSVTEDVDTHQNELASISELPAEKVIDRNNLLKCDECDVVFVTLDEFDLHMARHFKTPKFQCRYCSFGCSGFRNLVAHKTEVHLKELVSCKECQHIRAVEKPISAQGSSKEFECKLCEQQFKNKVQLMAHYYDVHLPRTIVCDVCGKKCVSYFKYRFHKKTHYEMNKAKCGECNREFKSQALLNKHKLHPCRTVPYLCAVCGETFARWVSLRIHLRGHTQFDCKDCDKKFADLRSLKFHMKSHNQTKFTCNLCSKIYKNMDNLKKHQATHDRLKCSVCDKMFKCLRHVRQHQIRHTTAKTHLCDICGTAVKRTGALVRHRALHFKEKYCECKYCSATFNTRIDRTVHMGRDHPEMKPSVPAEGAKNKQKLKCRYCDKILGSKYSLVDHERIHTGQFPYLCSVCGKRFTAAANLSQHMRSHTGVKRHACSLCGKKFVTKCHLENHVWSHSGEKRYSCETCGKKLALRDDMIRHCRIHAGELPYKCNLCGAGFNSRREMRQHKEEVHAALQN